MREERKRVTALFADLVGSTAIGERLDPEDAREVIGQAITRVIESVESMGGLVKDLAGDGVLAIFGAPAAHEDDAERAVRAGLAIAEEIEAYRDEVTRTWGLEEFGVRVAVETGVAVLGPVGGGGRVEYGATGDVLNTAARLQSHAEPGTVLVGAQTQRLVAAIFDWGPPRRLRLKGKAEAVTASVAVRARDVRGDVRRLARPRAPLVGRTRELARLAEAVSRVAEGEGRIVLVMGDAGIGKSRLLEEIRHLFEGHQEQPLWLESRCFSYTEPVPYWPIRELLQGWLDGSSDRSEAVRSALRAALTRLLGPGSDDEARLLGWVIGSGHEELPSDLSPELLRRRIQGTITEMLRRLSAEQPLAVVLDDLQWADPSSVGLVHQLLSLTAEVPMLLVLAARPETGHPVWGLRERAMAEHEERTLLLDLGPLAEGANRELVAGLLDRGILPPAVEDRILSAAEGNPFYLEEVVRALEDAGALVEEDGRWRFQSEARLEVPETVERVILARIDRLPSPARDLLDTAAVIGRRFGMGLLESVLGEGATSPQAITELLALDLVQEDPGPEGPRYTFKHPMIQEVAYGSLLRRHRRDLHRRVASALERSPEAGEDLAAELARHWREAGVLDAALRSFVLAAERADRIYAVDEALELYTAALEVAADLKISAEDARVQDLHLKRGVVRAHVGDYRGAAEEFNSVLRSATATGDQITEMRAHSELGFAQAGAADYRASVPHLDKALELAETLGQERAQVSILSRLSIVWTNLLRLDRGVEAGDRALALARRIGDEGASAEAMDALKQVALQLGDGERMESLAVELSQILRRLGDLWRLQFLLFERAYLAGAEARWYEAFGLLGEAIELNRRIGDRGNEALLLATLGWFRALRGEYGTAVDIGNRAVEVAREVGHQEWIAWSESMVGWTLLDLLIADRAAASLARARDAAARSGAMFHLQQAAAGLGWSQFLMGQREEALTTIREVEEMIDRVWTPSGTAHFLGWNSYLATARVHVASGAPARAEELVRPLVSEAERRGWAEPLGSGLLVLADCRRARGDPEAAHESLSRALEVAEAGELRAIQWRAHAALARTAPSRPGAPAHRDAAEEWILRLSARVPDENIARKFRAEALRCLAPRTTEEDEPWRPT